MGIRGLYLTVEAFPCCKALWEPLHSANSQEEFLHKGYNHTSATTALHLAVFAYVVFEDDYNDEDDKEVVVVFSGPFHERWHNASSAQTQLCCEQLHGRRHRGIPRWTGHLLFYKGENGNNISFTYLQWATDALSVLWLSITTNTALHWPFTVKALQN